MYQITMEALIAPVCTCLRSGNYSKLDLAKLKWATSGQALASKSIILSYGFNY